jgi:hypothetical protein
MREISFGGDGSPARPASVAPRPAVAPPSIRMSERIESLPRFRPPLEVSSD